MAGKKSRKNPLKVLEKIGKECLTGGLDTLIQNNVLKLEEEEKKKLNDAKPGDKPWVVVDAVRQKRHQVGQVLLQTVFNVDTKRHQVGQVLLQTVFNVDTKTNDTEAHPETDPKESPDALKLCTHEEFQRLCKEKAGEIYPIREKNDRTRLALIICNTEFEHFPWRSGAEHDIRGMTKLLEALDYTVVEEENLTASEMESVLRAFAGRSEHKTSDSTFLVFMSHGILEGICGTVHSDKNPDVLPYDTIFQILNNLNCISLKDKPKVIIVQACRGGRSGEVWARDSPESLPDSSSQSPTTLVEDGVYKTHVEKDFIAFFSSTPHNKSWRNKEKGSPFITELIGCFQKYSCRCHLEELFLKEAQPRSPFSSLACVFKLSLQ